jgi:hypothetical protein
MRLIKNDQDEKRFNVEELISGMCANVEDAKMLKNLYLKCACKCKRCKDVEKLMFCLKPTQMCKEVGWGKSRIMMVVMNKI